MESAHGTKPLTFDNWYLARAGGVSPADELSYTLLRPEVKSHETFGFVVRARAESGEDVLFWTGMYILRDGTAIIDTDLVQSTLVWGRYSAEEKQRMHEGNFVTKGQDLVDYHNIGEIAVERELDQVIWRGKGREFVASPPEWRIRGEHNGISCDIVVRTNGEAIWQYGPFSRMIETGAAGFELECTAEGTLEYNGMKLVLTGYANHEHCLFLPSAPRIVDASGGRGMNWAHGFSKDLQWYVMSQDAGPLAAGAIFVNGEQILDHDPKCTWIDEVGYWDDPVSNLKIPCKWHVWSRTPKGILDVMMQAYGRAYYLRTRIGGVAVFLWLLADGNGVFIHPDGREVRGDNMVCLLENMRTFHRVK